MRRRGSRPVPVVLSPKFHEYVSGSPSGSVAVAANVTGSGAMPFVGVAVAVEMTGFWLDPHGWSIVR